MNTYEYIWLDGYQPESLMRSKVKATEQKTAPETITTTKAPRKKKKRGTELTLDD